MKGLISIHLFVFFLSQLHKTMRVSIGTVEKGSLPTRLRTAGYYPEMAKVTQILA
jgi:hypothetical protein